MRKINGIVNHLYKEVVSSFMLEFVYNKVGSKPTPRKTKNPSVS